MSSSAQEDLERLAVGIINGDQQTAEAAVQQCHQCIESHIDDSRLSQNESSGNNSKGDD